MESFGIERGSIRSKALEKLAAFSLGNVDEYQGPQQNGHINGTNNNSKRTDVFCSDISKLVSAITSSDNVSSVPITHKELEIIIALAKSSKWILNFDQAQGLLEVLSPYFLESPFQQFKSHKSLQLSPSPWEQLTKVLTTAIIALTNAFPSLLPQSINLFQNYINSFKSDVKLASYFSLIGLLNSFVENKSLADEFVLKELHGLFSVDFLDSVESIISASLEDEYDYTYLLSYKSTGNEFSSLLFTKLLQAFSNRVVSSFFSYKSNLNQEKESLIDIILEAVCLDYDGDDAEPSLSSLKKSLLDNSDLLNYLVIKSLAQIDELDNGSTYINLSSTERVSLAFHTKSLSFNIIAAGLLVDIVASDKILDLVKNSLSHSQEIVDHELSPTIIALSSLLCFKAGKHISGQLVHSLPLIVSYYSTLSVSAVFIKKISRNFALGLKPLDQDSIITSIYSLINLVAVDSDGAPHAALNDLKLNSARNTFNGTVDKTVENRRVSRASTVNSLNLNSSVILTPEIATPNKPNHIFQNAITSVIEIAKVYDDKTITDLAVTVLSQKFRKVSKELDYYLLNGLSEIAPSLYEKEFLIVTKLFDQGLNTAIHDGDEDFINAVINARINVSKRLTENKGTHQLYFVYLNEILNNTVSRGDVQTIEHHRSHGVISQIAKQVSYFFKPLAALLPADKPLELSADDLDSYTHFRNFWFNLVVHGYNESSTLTEKFRSELEIIAFNSPPLASELPRLHTETSFELNTVLRRGSSNHNVKDQKHIIGGVSNSNSLEIRTLSYPRLMFLSATSLLEDLRVRTGDCSTILSYFSDPSIVKTNIEKYIGSIAISLIQRFVKLSTTGIKNPHFTADSISLQLTKILIFCCNRNYDLQDAAFQCANLFISKLPSSLYHSQSLFTLLDILTLLFDGVVDLSTNKFEPQHEFYLKHSKIKLTLSDSIKWRTSTLEKLHKKARDWCSSVLNKGSQDMKSLLQAYIAELGIYGGRSQNVEFGVSFAVELAGKISSSDLDLSTIVSTADTKPNTISGFLSQYSWRSRIVTEKASFVPIDTLRKTNATDIVDLKRRISNGEEVSDDSLLDILDSIASLLILNQHEESAGLIRDLVSLPFAIFNANTIKYSTTIWLSIIKERSDIASLMISEIVSNWEDSIKEGKGLYSKSFDLTDEAFLKMTYSPTDKGNIDYHSKIVLKNLQAHLHLIKLFASNFQGTLYQSVHLLRIFTRGIKLGLDNLNRASLHPYSRLIRNELVKLGLDILNVHLKTNSKYLVELSESVYDGLLSWYHRKGHYPYGGNDLNVRADYNLLVELYERVKILPSPEKLVYKKILSLIFLKDEISRTLIWLTSTNPVEFKGESPKVDSALLSYAFSINPRLAINLADRFPSLQKALSDIISKYPEKSSQFQESVSYLLQSPKLYKYLLFAKPISPTDSINLFQSAYFKNPYVIQYNMRSLESHDINLTFFYVPQIVQCLRSDPLGYVGRFIVETGKVNQLFAHQIIWNMLANRYKDEESTVEDSIKPVLDSVREKMISSFTKEDLVFFDTEFKFFNEVTDISGKLKPYIKKTKAEKKTKIDEEMSKIVVVKNVYLPSNPDGTIVDINRTSGKPLQSHAKAPFMATFKIKKVQEHNGQQVAIEKWQSAIFKVGDDCRQDVLALQLISIFKSVWENSGLDLYCFPYRVTATAPGCGVIDVLPNSISRDMLGREAVNGLYEYFTSKFGNENSIEFENARNNFVKSLAAYSIISYLLQFKDRHNGNIMYDDQGHILHIDFGFCFDIVPGGVKFEAVPFKLTKEMVKVMGGSNETESFAMFEELFIKGFLAIRPFASLIIGNVRPMLSSGLPCFKGEKTIKNLTNRFFLNKDDKDVISSLKRLIKKSYESMFTVGYDKFQKMTNGIPY